MSRHLGQALFGLAKSCFELLQLLLSRADCVFPVACFSGAQAGAALVRHTFPQSSWTSRRLPLSQTWSPGRQRSSAQWCCEAVSIADCAKGARQHLRFRTRARGPLGLLLLFRHVVQLGMRKGFESGGAASATTATGSAPASWLGDGGRATTGWVIRRHTSRGAARWAYGQHWWFN